MKLLKKSSVLLLIVLTTIIGSWTFVPGFSGWNVLDRVQANQATITHVAPEVNSSMLQSTDGGRTWQDISRSLPELKEPEGFFAGASEIYVRTNGVLYRSSNLKTPVWEKENIPDQRSTSIAFNRSGVIAYSYDGHIYQRKSSSDPASDGDWLPIYTSLKSTNLELHEVATIFEASDGSVFRSTGKSFSKSTDKARTWKLVQKGWVGDVVESAGVLLATGTQGIMRSTDMGEHWDWVISEGGVGIAIEQIEGGHAAIAYHAKTKSRRVHVSFDEGKTWRVIDDGLQPSMNISSVKHLGNDLFVGHPDGIFRSSDLGKTWQRVHASVDNEFKLSDATKSLVATKDNRRVFKLYVSNNVLYAVAVLAGC